MALNIFETLKVTKNDFVRHQILVKLVAAITNIITSEVLSSSLLLGLSGHSYGCCRLLCGLVVC